MLKGLDFKINPGDKVGVVGRTGAGKSTLAMALTRIVEIEQGHILIDGQDTKDIELASLRRQITIIPQESALFEGTLKYNLDPEGNASEQDMLRMIKSANMTDLLERDPKGLEQKIESEGTNLSSGEKQLVCICRAALRRSKIVLLDEATANIDTNTEKAVQALINSEFKDATMLTIAH